MSPWLPQLIIYTWDTGYRQWNIKKIKKKFASNAQFVEICLMCGPTISGIFYDWIRLCEELRSWNFNRKWKDENVENVSLNNSLSEDGLLCCVLVMNFQLNVSRSYFSQECWGYHRNSYIDDLRLQRLKLAN